MAAALPGSSVAENLGNPATGRTVLLDPLSGPKGSMLDAKTIDSWLNGSPVYLANDQDLSTGALCTGIGFGSPPIIGVPAVNDLFPPGNFTDTYIPGVSLPGGTFATDGRLRYIGGGASNPDGTPVALPINSLAICMAGNGGSRDGGAGPAYGGFPIKTVTATGAVAPGAAVETGYVNRCGRALVAGETVFGSATAALAPLP
jgi:hypothetical protein